MTNVESDHYPEVVDNERGTRRLELMGIKEHLRDPDERRALYADMTDEQYMHMFGYVNSITQGKQIEYEYEEGSHDFMPIPSSEDKAPLMDLTFKTVRMILSDSDLDTQTALRRAGLTIAGAINYIHAKGNGNGRSGRALHYLIEFGTERGDEAFNEEMYAVIGKLPVYDTDKKIAIYDTQPIEVDKALDAEVRRRYPETHVNMSPSERASARVVVFLDMMRDTVRVPILEEDIYPPGSAAQDCLSFYEREYLALSAIPNRLPDDVPEGAHRVLADKADSDTPTIRVPVDIV